MGMDGRKQGGMSGAEVGLLVLPLLCVPALVALAVLEYSTPSPVRFDFCQCKFVRKQGYELRQRERFSLDDNNEMEQKSPRSRPNNVSTTPLFSHAFAGGAISTE